MTTKDEAMRLQYEIADEYLPDTTVNGMDCPNTELAGEIINKILDAAVGAAEAEKVGANKNDHPEDKAYDRAITYAVEGINTLRPTGVSDDI